MTTVFGKHPVMVQLKFCNIKAFNLNFVLIQLCRNGWLLLMIVIVFDFMYWNSPDFGRVHSVNLCCHLCADLCCL